MSSPDITAAATEIPWQQLLRSAREGSREAVGRALGRSWPRLLRWARSTYSRSLGPDLDAEDLAQIACLIAFDRFESFRGVTEAQWDAWLRTILLNAGRHALKRPLRLVARGVRFECVADLDRLASRDSGATVQEPDLDDQSFIRDRLIGTPVRERVAVILRIGLGWSVSRVAARLGCSQSMIRKHLARFTHRTAPHRTAPHRTAPQVLIAIRASSEWGRRANGGRRDGTPVATPGRRGERGASPSVGRGIGPAGGPSWPAMRRGRRPSFSNDSSIDHTDRIIIGRHLSSHEEAGGTDEIVGSRRISRPEGGIGGDQGQGGRVLLIAGARIRRIIDV